MPSSASDIARWGGVRCDGKFVIQRIERNEIIFTTTSKFRCRPRAAGLTAVDDAAGPGCMMASGHPTWKLHWHIRIDVPRTVGDGRRWWLLFSRMSSRYVRPVTHPRFCDPSHIIANDYPAGVGLRGCRGALHESGGPATTSCELRECATLISTPPATRADHALQSVFGFGYGEIVAWRVL